ncbi:carbamoyltransferase HypF [Desulfovibrio litoralis]|uniref:Carbamoyltransferase n=1 Tax=Desulfovibrio litoralis DSM 11393 TaxID=1121455 RepID=A0A1M7SF74_9BACT|nr:carbamoyltransferase HypF [Desulfovibrio litoralis]SHN57148.1 hydrogenase maturation protein HypF [Desulfovibrio litoralis DSM 11393]
MNQERKKYSLKGQVQGVGFRPFIYKLALDNKLTGFVRNDAQGVYIELQGNQSSLNAFEKELYLKLPPLAKITECKIESQPLQQDEKNFVIAHSQNNLSNSELEVSIPPDIGICVDCEKDMLSGRRKDYPFTNCTNCGPRYSIIKQVPYDRKFTTMACFPLCDACKNEYENPLDRRFHAQPNACPVCGPKTWLVKPQTQDNNTLTQVKFPHTTYQQAQYKDFEAIDEAARLLSQGYILAMKGLGGFHLVCDASNIEAIQNLRQRKQRPDKAFALMLKDLNEAEKISILTIEDKALLSSPERPIVLCQKQKDCKLPQELIAPDSEQLGIMLAYTPMQKILLESFAKYQQEKQLAKKDNKKQSYSALIMTSGNKSGLPLCKGNREAIEHLSDFVDAFLLHDRDILLRIDDSVVAAQQVFYQNNIETESSQNILPNFIFLRRARGYVPKLIELIKTKNKKQVLGMGAELKSTLCFIKNDKALISQHIGDLDNLEIVDFQRELIEHLSTLLNFKADCLVHDLHPNFLSTKLAKELAELWEIPAVELQHHYAHARSLGAETQTQSPFLCLSLDGTGYGEDKTIWGGELLLIDPSSTAQKRLASLDLFPILGGDIAIKEPWRLAYGALLQYNLLPFADSWIKNLSEDKHAQLPILETMFQRKLNVSLTSSLGRLFDAVSALLSLSSVISYEGQAAQRLEQAIYQSTIENSSKKYSYSAFQNFDKIKTYDLPLITETKRDLDCFISLKPFFIQLLNDINLKKEKHEISLAFHISIAKAFMEASEAMSKKYKINKLGLTGGCFANRFLLNYCIKEAKYKGLDVFYSDKLPFGDGAISLGQASFGQLLK